MSISAAIDLSSQRSDIGSMSPAASPARRPRRRPKYPANARTQKVAAKADGRRAENSVTAPNGRLHRTTAM